MFSEYAAFISIVGGAAFISIVDEQLLFQSKVSGVERLDYPSSRAVGVSVVCDDPHQHQVKDFL